MTRAAASGIAGFSPASRQVATELDSRGQPGCDKT
jgi:hypothetical protein